MPPRQKIPPHPPVRLALTVDEVAHAIGIGRSSVYVLMKEGRLPYFYARKNSRRVWLRDLEALGGRK